MSETVIGTNEFIRPWADCMDPEDVPQTCQECYYLTQPTKLKIETHCKFVSLYDVKKKVPACEIGNKMLKAVGKKATLNQLFSVAYGWKSLD